MNELEVNCIDRFGTAKSHEAITHIGNVQQGWRITHEEAIARVEAQTHAFYTIHVLSGLRAYLGVVRTPGRRPYLRARAGKEWNDHLLTQQACGVACRYPEPAQTPFFPSS